MSLLSKLATDNSIQEEGDVLGGGFQPLESGTYNHTVSMAYLNKSKGGALGLFLTLKDDKGAEFRHTLWMTSGTEKGSKNYWENDKGEKRYLPGFVAANDLCLLAAGKEISQMDTETKVVPIYNFQSRSEEPTQVEVIMDLLGKEIITGVLKQTVDQNTFNSATNRYEPSGETRDANEIDKFFRASDKMTTAEVRAQVEEAAFITSWEDKWKGVTQMRAKGAAAGGAKAGAPKAAHAAKPTTSLFATT